MAIDRDLLNRVKNSRLGNAIAKLDRDKQRSGFQFISPGTRATAQSMGQNIQAGYNQWKAKPSNTIFSNPRAGVQNIRSSAERLLGGAQAEVGRLGSSYLKPGLGKNFIEASTRIPGQLTGAVSFGAVNPLANQQAQSNLAKGTDLAAQMAGFGASPVTKGIIKATDPLARKIVGKTAQKLLPYAGTIAPRVGSAVANVAQGFAFDAAQGRMPTPGSVGLDVATGAVFGPSQFNSGAMAKGFDFGRNSKMKWDPNDVSELDAIKDFLRSKKLGDAEIKEADTIITSLARNYLPVSVINKLASDYGKNSKGFLKAMVKELDKSAQRLKAYDAEGNVAKNGDFDIPNIFGNGQLQMGIVGKPTLEQRISTGEVKKASDLLGSKKQAMGKLDNLINYPSRLKEIGYSDAQIKRISAKEASKIFNESIAPFEHESFKTIQKSLQTKQKGQLYPEMPKPLEKMNFSARNQSSPGFQTATPPTKIQTNQAQQGFESSLNDIVSKTDINVKNKVGIFDYIRTPDRVLKKIGLEKEAKLIRQKYDDYLTQLPKEISKVTDWSKRVGPESNQKIFKYLDGQKGIALTPNEKAVASEIKSYLADWADKLGLPKDKRIASYITHIFEKDFIQKEFDPDLAKLIKNKVAGSVYDPFLEKRLGTKGYVEDTWRALDAYIKRATRKYNMDQALEKTKKAAESLETSQYNFVKEYVDRINLRPTDKDNLLDNSIKQVVGYKFGQRPTAAISRGLRQMVYRGALGLNFGSALKNLTQGANTYAKLGEKHTVKGYVDLLKNGTKELEDVGVLRQGFVEDRALNATKKFWENTDKALFALFETAEKINRGSAYYGAKSKALSEGMDESAAIEYAKKIVRDTQFTFGSVDTPVALQSDIAKTIGQFQSFTLKQGEFLGEMVQNKEYAGLLRYTLASLAFVYAAGDLLGMEPKDIIPSFRVGIPPTLKAPVEIGKAILNSPDKYGNSPDNLQKAKNIGNAGITLVPGGVQAKKTITGVRDVVQGASKARNGDVKYEINKTPTNYAKAGLFGPYALPEARKYYDNKNKPKEEQNNQSLLERMGFGATDEAVDTQTELPTNLEDLSTLYEDVSRVTGNYRENKLKTQYGLVQKDLEDYQAEFDAANDLKRRIERERPEQIKELQRIKVSKQTNDEKTLYVLDQFEGFKDTTDMMRFLVNNRKPVNGKLIMSDGVIDNLVSDGLIPYELGKQLKKLDLDENGKLKIKQSSGGKGKVSARSKAEKKYLQTLAKISSKPVKIKTTQSQARVGDIKGITFGDSV